MRPAVLALCVLLSAPAAAQPGAEDCAAPEARAAAALISPLLDWIADNTDYDVAETRASPPRISFCSPGDTLSYEGATVLVDPDLRAAYDARARQIHLVRPWDPTDPFAQSVLLHELIHDVQLLNRTWPCLQAPEWQAYKLQDSWLRARGIEHGFDWFAIFVLARCPRDPHP